VADRLRKSRCEVFTETSSHHESSCGADNACPHCGLANPNEGRKRKCSRYLVSQAPQQGGAFHARIETSEHPEFHANTAFKLLTKEKNIPQTVFPIATFFKTLKLREDLEHMGIHD
jgi:hypothetical protein